MKYLNLLRDSLGVFEMVVAEIGQAFIIALFAVFLMELGDKTQLTAFALGLKYRAPVKVFMGVIVGLFGVTIIAVILGVILKLPHSF